MNSTSIHTRSEIDLIILKKKCSPRIRLIFNILKILITRSVLVVECAILITFMVCITEQYPFLILITLLIIMILDAFWICIRRRGKEYEFFSISTFLFSIGLERILLFYDSIRFKKNHLNFSFYYTIMVFKLL